MATVHLNWHTHPPMEFTHGCVTVGNFDGVHRGHQALIAAAREHAEAVHGPAVAVTFDPPPAVVLHNAALQPPLTTIEERADLLHQVGATHVVVLKTEPGLLALNPDSFFEEVLQRLFAAKAVVEGFNFRFGRARTGDTTTLRELCNKAGMVFHEVQALKESGEMISSSRIRSAIQHGDVVSAAGWLGRRYSAAGVVGTGAQRGRTIGFPTANLVNVHTQLPKEGVYAVRVNLGTETKMGAANLGPSPTFGEQAKKFEVHLLDFAGDLYGRSIRVDFVQRLRDTKPFKSVAELIDQLHADVATTRKLLKAERE